MENHGSCGINVLIALKDVILITIMCKNTLIVTVQATIPLHYAGKSMKSVENVPTKSLIIELM